MNQVMFSPEGSQVISNAWHSESSPSMVHITKQLSSLVHAAENTARSHDSITAPQQVVDTRANNHHAQAAAEASIAVGQAEAEAEASSFSKVRVEVLKSALACLRDRNLSLNGDI